MQIAQNRAGYWVLTDESGREQMHPLGNPLTESTELYVRPTRLVERLSEDRAEPLVLWDVGLGMGSNALAAITHWRQTPSRGNLHLFSFENLFTGFQTAAKNTDKFPALLDPLAQVFAQTAKAEEPGLMWTLLEGDFFERVNEASAPDVIFFDPFSRNTNPRFWEQSCFSTLLRAAGQKATVLATYANARAVRQTMVNAGWKVALGPGFANRNQTTLAVTAAEALLRDYRWWV